MTAEQGRFWVKPSLLRPSKDFGVGGKEGSMDIHESVEALKAGMSRVSDRIIGRERLIEQTLLAILTREHQLIFSRTGTAKTLYAQSVFQEFAAETFAIQFTKGTTEEAVVGAYDLNEFKAGRIWHRTQNSIVTADFAFLDEFMDANDMVLRSILGILNERRFTKGEQKQDAKLHTAIAVTNYLRQSEMSEAVMDRFLFKATLDPKTTTLNEMLIDRVYGRHNGRVVMPETPLSMDVPRNLAKIVKGENLEHLIVASYAILFLKNQIIKKYAELATAEKRKTNSKAEELYVSPRTMAKARDVLNASALLNHRFEVTGEDLTALRFILTAVSGQDTAADDDKNQELFSDSVDQVINVYSQDELEQVEKIMLTNEYFEAFKRGESVEAIRSSSISIIRRILEFFRLTHWGQVNTATFTSALIAMTIKDSQIDAMRKELIEKIDNA
jgi:MoxR-like ATPase